MNEQLGNFFGLLGTVCVSVMVLGTVLSLVSAAQSMIGTAQLQLNNSMAALTAQAVKEYSNQNKNGSAISTAISMYGSSMAIIVRTTAINKQIGDPDVAFNYGIRLKGCYESNEEKLKASNETIYLIPVKDTEDDDCIYNYNGEETYHGELEDGINLMNMETSGLTSRGCPQYIIDSSLFRTSLITDMNNDYVGIFFDQVR